MDGLIFDVDGEIIKGNCSQCMLGTCNMITGTCKECKPGYLGSRCDIMCPAGTHSTKCLRRCPNTCEVPTSCHHVTGVCLNGCVAGYSGHYCNETCASGYYGKNCAQMCSFDCFRQSCHLSNGRCISCRLGRVGHFCDKLSSPRDANVSTQFVVTSIMGMFALGISMWAFIACVIFLKGLLIRNVARRSGSMPPPWVTRKSDYRGIFANLSKRKKNDDDGLWKDRENLLKIMGSITSIPSIESYLVDDAQTRGYIESPVLPNVITRNFANKPRFPRREIPLERGSFQISGTERDSSEVEAILSTPSTSSRVVKSASEHTLTQSQQSDYLDDISTTGLSLTMFDSDMHADSTNAAMYVQGTVTDNLWFSTPPDSSTRISSFVEFNAPTEFIVNDLASKKVSGSLIDNTKMSGSFSSIESMDVESKSQIKSQKSSEVSELYRSYPRDSFVDSGMQQFETMSGFLNSIDEADRSLYADNSIDNNIDTVSSASFDLSKISKDYDDTEHRTVKRVDGTLSSTSGFQRNELEGYTSNKVNRRSVSLEDALYEGSTDYNSVAEPGYSVGYRHSSTSPNQHIFGDFDTERKTHSRFARKSRRNISDAGSMRHGPKIHKSISDNKNEHEYTSSNSHPTKTESPESTITYNPMLLAETETPNNTQTQKQNYSIGAARASETSSSLKTSITTPLMIPSLSGLYDHTVYQELQDISRTDSSDILEEKNESSSYKESDFSSQYNSESTENTTNSEKLTSDLDETSSRSSSPGLPTLTETSSLSTSLTSDATLNPTKVQSYSELELNLSEEESDLEHLNLIDKLMEMKDKGQSEIAGKKGVDKSTDTLESPVLHTSKNVKWKTPVKQSIEISPRRIEKMGYNVQGSKKDEMRTTKEKETTSSRTGRYFSGTFLMSRFALWERRGQGDDMDDNVDVADDDVLSHVNKIDQIA